jgi:hypothetical protein
VNPQYDVVADSLDVMMPDQRLREVRAVRKAFAQSVPDSTRLHTTERDWLRGDTIVAHFDTTGVGDSTKQPPIRQLVALGHASSFYHIATKDTTALGPAINYVKGRDITIAFVDKQVRRVTVLDQAAGLYLEPGVANDSTKQKARSTTTAPAPNPRPRRP